jgi:hypothetical protein
MHKIRLIHWNESQGAERAEQLRIGGYDVEFKPLEANELKSIRQEPPDAIVIDLTRSPAQGRDLGLNFRKYKSSRFTPLVFAGGEADKVARVRNLLPDAAFSDWDEIDQALQNVIAHPPQDPIVPDSTFAAYAGTPLPQKLGIKTGTRIVLFSAPPDIETTLGELPENAAIQREGNPGDLHLWFVRSREELETNIQSMGLLTKNGPLWIIWPKKSSKLAGDLTQNIVRQTGLGNGLVDYKICSIDDTWSGLCFTFRKEG